MTDGHFSPDVIGATPYVQLDNGQIEALYSGAVAPISRVIEVAMEQEPPNEGVITAIHLSARIKLDLAQGNTRQLRRLQRDGTETVTKNLVAATAALDHLASPEAQ